MNGYRKHDFKTYLGDFPCILFLIHSLAWEIADQNYQVNFFVMLPKTPQNIFACWINFVSFIE